MKNDMKKKINLYLQLMEAAGFEVVENRLNNAKNLLYIKLRTKQKDITVSYQVKVRP